jgi:hypothetical protein
MFRHILVGINKGEVEMIFDKTKLKVVIIDYPILALDNPDCSRIFGKTLKMKYEGYATAYNNKILPMDKTDFFGTHLILCEEIENELFPIFSYKSVTLDRCKFHEMEFPILSLMLNDGHPTCAETINKIISSVDASAISYDSSWAQDIKYRFTKSPELKILLGEIAMMFMVRHHQDAKISNVITNGVVKVKTDLFFQKLGFKKLTENENSHFIQKNLDNEECIIFHTNEFSFEALSCAKKHQALWDNKLMIDGLEISRVARSTRKTA